MPTSLRPVFAAAPAAKDLLYSEAQVREALQQYAAANALRSADGVAVKLDRLLHGNLFNKKEAFQEGEQDALEDLVKRLLGKLQLFHRVVRISEQVQPRMSPFCDTILVDSYLHEERDQVVHCTVINL